jgi:hypothetical protein
MTTLDDLRQTLDRHAAAVTDDALDVRADQVHGRVGVARRRRQGVVAAAVAGVIGAVSVGVLSGGGTTPQPAEPDRRLGDFTAPATLTSLGYTYEYVTGASDPSIASLQLEASDEPRLVTWATAEEGVKLAEESDRGEDRVFSSGLTAFDDFTILPAGSSATYTAYAYDVALAVYELSDVPPEGDTAHGITFRDQPAGATRISSVIAEPGAADVTLGVRQPDGGMRLSFVCAGAPQGYQHLSVDGEESVFGPGCDDPTFDPAGRGGVTLERDPQVAPGDTVTLRLWVTDGRNGPLLRSDALQLGLGAYELDPPGDRLAGSGVPALREHDGHVWVQSGAAAGSPGARELSSSTENGVPTLAELYWRGAGDAVVEPTLDGRRIGDRFAVGSGSTLVSGSFFTGGSEVGARVSGTPNPDVELALAFYTRLD